MTIQKLRDRTIRLNLLLPTERERKEQRFWERVEKTDTCWNWTGAAHPNGRGYVFYLDEKYPAHRMAYAFQVDTVPRKLRVWQTCGNPRCVRPEHIQAGSVYDYGRWKAQSEETHSRSRLDWAKVDEIRRLYDRNWRQVDLANQYNVSIGTISNIVNYKTWRKRSY